jgi:hypothetical protein
MARYGTYLKFMGKCRRGVRVPAVRLRIGFTAGAMARRFATTMTPATSTPTSQ